MNEPFFAALSAWLTQAGLAGTAETDIVPGFCERCVAAGLPLARAVVFIDTLHPVHEGRLFRWGYDPAQAPFTAAPARTGSLPPVSIRRMFKPPRAGAIAPLPDAADGRLAVTPPAERCDQRRVRVAVGFVRRGCNRLRRYHQPLRRGQCHRRNGQCLLVMGNEGAGWIQRWPDHHA